MNLKAQIQKDWETQSGLYLPNFDLNEFIQVSAGLGIDVPIMRGDVIGSPNAAASLIEDYFKMASM